MDKVQAAREQTFEDKLLAGPQMFDLCCEFARTGIRMQNPNANEDEVERELDRRLAIARRLEG